jgi:uncharacterized protein YbjT (DUF2867 family)
MRIVVIGGTGLIGSKLVHALTERGHDAVAAAPSTGVNTFTGEGLSEALAGATVVVDVSNSPTLDDAAIEFFRTATTNVLTAEEAAGVDHHVALSVVGTETLALQSGCSSRRSPTRRPSMASCACHPPTFSRWRPSTSLRVSPSPRSVTR